MRWSMSRRDSARSSQAKVVNPAVERLLEAKAAQEERARLRRDSVRESRPPESAGGACESADPTSRPLSGVQADETAADQLTKAFQQLKVASQPEAKPTAAKPAVRAAIDLCSSSDESGARGPAHGSSSSSNSGTGSDIEPGPLQPRPGPAEARHPSSAPQPHHSDTAPLGFDLSWTAAPSSSPAESQQSSNDLMLGSHGQFRLRAAVSGKLYAHQLEGLAWLYSLKAGGILGDDMGLGKVGLAPWQHATSCCLCGCWQSHADTA